MDETTVWSDMVRNVTVDTTGTKEVPLKSTRNEKVKVSVCLTAKADGTKLKPFIVSQDAKREATALKEELKNRCVVESSSNGWMNEELVLNFLRQVLGMLPFKKRLFALDTFDAQMTEDVRMKTDDALIPGGCIKYVQAPDVVWNKPFKGYIMESYDEWLASGVHQHTEAGNMKPASRHLVVVLILESWNRLEKNLTIKSFKSCGLNLKTDGSEDHLIHCFKEDQPCANGLDLVKEQQNVLSNAEYLNGNPFEITESDTEKANTNNNLIDSSDSEDDLIDIEL